MDEYVLAFRARTRKGLQQQQRELQWIQHNLTEARNKGNKHEIEKWEDKLERWLDAHPYTKKSYEEATLQWARTNKEEFLRLARERGIITEKEEKELLEVVGSG